MGGQAKTETRTGPEPRDEGSHLLMPDVGQAMLRLPAEVSLGLMRSPTATPGQGIWNPPDIASMSLAKNTSPAQEVTKI